MAEFKVGDVVQLKSGGPPMTVIELGVHSDPRRIWCKWFVDSIKVEQGDFPPDALAETSPDRDRKPRQNPGPRPAQANRRPR